jgi:hypothetical protein
MTEEEKQSSLGASLLFVKGLLHNMTDVLLKQRHGITGRPPKNSAVADDSSYSESSDGEEYYDEEEDEEQDNKKPPPPQTTATASAASVVPLHSKSQKRKLPHEVSGDKSKHQIAAGPHNHYNFPHPAPYPGGPPVPPPFHRPPPGGYPYPPAPYYGGPPRPMPPQMHGAYPPPPPHYNQPPYVNPYGPGHYPHYPPPGPAPVPDGSYSQYHHHQSSQYDYYQYNQDGGPPQSHSYEAPLNDDRSPEVQDEPYPDLTQTSSFGTSHNEQPRKKKRSRHERKSSEDDSHHYDEQYAYSVEDEDAIHHDRKSNSRSADVRSNSPSISPLFADRTKRKISHKHHSPKFSMETAFETDDEDRGIPGSSKVASPDHDHQSVNHNPSPIKSRRKRNLEFEQIIPPQQTPKRQSPSSRIEKGGSSMGLYLESPSEDNNDSNNQALHHHNEDHHAGHQTPPASRVRLNENFSPENMLDGTPHLSPTEMSVVSKMSHDNHHGAVPPSFWAPLSIDINDNFMDHDHHNHQEQR